MPSTPLCSTSASCHNRLTPLLLVRDRQQYHFSRLGATACAATAAPAGPSDEFFMGLALHQAQLAAEAGEVPIGAVLVINSEVAAAAYNQTETRCNPLSHAELLCISAAAEQQLAWRLQEATLYSTIEPCPMCAGAILQARLARLVYGARQPRVGADGSWVAMFPRQPQQELTNQQQWQDATAAECEGQDSSQQQQQQGQLQGATAASQQACLSDAQQPLRQQQQQQQQQEGQEQQPQQLQQPLQPIGPHPFHPNIQVTGGVRADECAALMKVFFQQRRKQQKAAAAAAAAATAEVAAAAPGQCSCNGDMLRQSQSQLAEADGGTGDAGRASQLDAAVWLGSSLSMSSRDEEPL